MDRHAVVFRTDGGTKPAAAVRGSRVAFEIDGADEAARQIGEELLTAFAIRGPAWRTSVRPRRDLRP